VKISPRNIESFLAAPPQSLHAVLVYGPDFGLVRERGKSLIRAIVEDPSDPFRITELSPAEMKNDPARLADEAAAMALTGGRRVVSVRDATDTNAGDFAEFLNQPIGDALIVVEAGNLGPRSKLRKVFDDAKTAAAAIPCYADDVQTLNDVIAKTLGDSGLRVSRDAMAYLSANLGSDRMISRTELEKLALYMAGHEEVSLDDAMACVGDSASMTLDDLVYAAAGGDLATLPKMQDRAVQEGVEPIAILRALGRHFQRLHACAGLMAEGAPLDGAMKALRPPIFFRQADAFRAQLRLWGPADVNRALDWLTSAEKDCKSTGFPAETICHQTLLRLAASARALAGRRRR
jgi:DNA polymerase-3 subunit delta